MHVFICADDYQNAFSDKDPKKLIIDCRELTEIIGSKLNQSSNNNYLMRFSDFLLNDFLDSNPAVQKFLTDAYEQILLFISETYTMSEICFAYDTSSLLAIYFAEKATNQLMINNYKAYFVGNELLEYA